MREAQLCADLLRPWERGTAQPEDLQGVFNALLIDQPARLEFLCLLKTSPEGLQEATLRRRVPDWVARAGGLPIPRGC